MIKMKVISSQLCSHLVDRGMTSLSDSLFKIKLTKWFLFLFIWVFACILPSFLSSLLWISKILSFFFLLCSFHLHTLSHIPLVLHTTPTIIPTAATLFSAILFVLPSFYSFSPTKHGRGSRKWQVRKKLLRVNKRAAIKAFLVGLRPVKLGFSQLRLFLLITLWKVCTHTHTQKSTTFVGVEF